MLRSLPFVLLVSMLPTVVPATADAFGDHWYQGRAEITSYTLEQARYGQVHPGEAVLIFVTEDLSREKQVKLDRPEIAGSDAVKVLKLNATRKFLTGLYPYSTMTSTFSPVDVGADGGALKITASSQEWCGHTWSQLNRTPDGWDLRAFSYFESEGDEERELPPVFAEDDVWNRIRLDPATLPTGEFPALPGTVFSRLRHVPWGARTARASRTTEGAFGVYTLEFPELGRRLEIRFETAFPHAIESWEETTRSGFGPDAPSLTTTATRRKSLMVDYWSRNRLEDRALREQLGLDPER